MTSADLARRALDWLLAEAVPVDDGLAWEDDGELDPTLYSGTAGVVLALLEAAARTGDDRCTEAAHRGADWLRRQPAEASGLLFGLTGTAVALHAVDPTDPAVDRAMAKVRDRQHEGRWGEQTELLGGNAGIALGALAVGDVDLAVAAVEPNLGWAEPTAHGVQWEVRAGMPARFHHVSHGTLGIALALVEVGVAAGRDDLLQLGLAGAADVVARDTSGGDGFLVPHSDPQHRPAVVERFSYGWCHGPSGDARAFARIGALTGDRQWLQLVDRCWHTVTTSGVPERRRPGFWDNNGRCCGTAGVLATALDVGDLAFADLLVADLERRAIGDDAGARWSNVEHRMTPSDLPPCPGWAMGNAGILVELLRHADGDGRYEVSWPV